MSSTPSALDMLINKVTSAVAQLNSIQWELMKSTSDSRSPELAAAMHRLRGLRDELTSACDEAHDATTTGPPTSGKTNSTGTSSATPAATGANARASAQSMRTTACPLDLPHKEVPCDCYRGER